jgi:tetratricopeptide (TPR) repeat protein
MNPFQSVKTAAQAATRTVSKLGARKRQVRVLLDLALSQRNQNKLADACETAETVRELIEAEEAHPRAEKAQCLDLLGGIALEKGDHALARQYFGEALDVERHLRPPVPAAIVERCRRLASAESADGEGATAREHLEEALQLAEDALGTEHAKTADVLFDLGKALQQVGDHAAAQPVLARALDIHRQQQGSGSDEVARDYQVLATSCQALGEFEKAAEYYRKALFLLERQLGGNSADLAHLMINLARIHSDSGRYAPALELLQQAVGRMECSHDEHLALALQNLGAVYSRCGRYRDAASTYVRARRVWQQMPGDHQAEIEDNTGLIAGITPHLKAEDVDGVLAGASGHPNFRMAPLTRATVQAGDDSSSPVFLDAPAEMDLYAGDQLPGPPSTALAAPQVMVLGEGRPMGLIPANQLLVSAPVAQSVWMPQSAGPPAATTVPRLNGWEELAFDLLEPA